MSGVRDESEGLEGGGCGYKRATRRVFLVIDLFSTLTGVNIGIYTGDRIVQNLIRTAQISTTGEIGTSEN